MKVLGGDWKRDCGWNWTEMSRECGQGVRPFSETVTEMQLNSCTSQSIQSAKIQNISFLNQLYKQISLAAETILLFEFLFYYFLITFAYFSLF